MTSTEILLRNTFEEYLNRSRPVWNQYLENALNEVPNQSWDRQTLKEYQKMMAGGKHLRACLVILGYQLAEKELDDAIALASLSVEALHNAFLIHDDIVDKSDRRRNAPTLHVQHEQDAIQAGIDAVVAKDVGVASALHIGDVGQALAQRILIDSQFSSQALLSCIRLFNMHLWNTVMGQLLDMEQIDIENLNEDYVENVHKRKTAYYSFVLPLIMGYTLGGGSPKYVDELNNYAVRVGTVYQMQDDVLGIFGDQEELGKPVDTDIKEGKKTLLVCRALKVLTGDRRDELLRSYGKEDISQQQVLRVGEIIRESGALDYSNQKATRLISEATAAIQSIPMPRAQHEILNALAEYVGTRKF